MVVLIFGDYPVLSRSIFPLICTVRFVVVYTQINCLQTFEHMNMCCAIKISVFVKFH